MDKPILRIPLLWGMALLFAAMLGLTVAIFFVVLAEGEDFGTAARITGPWVGGLVGLVIATLTGMYVVATQAMARATAELAEETKRAREEGSAPVVIPYFEFRRRLLMITVENIGAGLAHKVHVAFEPPIPSRKGVVQKLPVNTDSIPTLRPREKFPHLLDGAPNFFSNEDNPRFYVASVTCEDINGEPKSADYPLDLTVYEGMLAEEKGIADLVKEVEQIRRRFDAITDASALQIKTQRDVEREYQEALERIQERKTKQQKDESQQKEPQSDP